MVTGKLVRMTGGRKQREGFTLLELLVVVGILATLVALALPYYQDYINQSRITAAQTDLTTFSKAIALYDLTEPTPFATSTFLPLIGRYMQDFRTFPGQTIPRDPWGNDYKVDCAKGIIVSAGPDGNDDTSATYTGSGGAKEDDILSIIKPPFFITARALGDKMVEITFSRKVKDAEVDNTEVAITNPALTSISKQKVSATIYRFSFASAMTPKKTHTATIAAGGVTSQDGNSIGTDINPNTGNNGRTVDFDY